MIRISDFQNELFLIFSALSLVCLSCKSDQILDNLREQEKSIALL